MPPDAALGPATPPKKIAKATGRVTSAASQSVPCTAVPMASTALPTRASPRCAIALSRLVPPNEARTSVAKLPKAANVAICRLPMTTKVSANRPGITIVARSARMAAGVDHFGTRAAGTAPPDGSRNVRARGGAGAGAATAESGIDTAYRQMGHRRSRESAAVARRLSVSRSPAGAPSPAY